jgi:2,3-bisphosphoglycerate-independent phosphoglycerate mutase
MKYCVLIVDGAAGRPLAERGGATSLELARTPNLDAMAKAGTLGLVRTVPGGMEPSSACACLSILGYDPEVYYRGRAGIEARSLGIDIGDGEVVFRCNLVATSDGRMWDYSAGHISTGEARQLIQGLGSDSIEFYPGTSYRHICKISGREETLLATCTPPHDIPGKAIEQYLPRGPGSQLLNELMAKSEAVLRDHPVNRARRARGDIPATMVWLFWGSGRAPDMPAFEPTYGLRAALTSGVDLLRGLARLAGMDVLEIAGVTDGRDNDYAAQAAGALEALKTHDLVVIHVEAPDEAAHGGLVDDKIEAIQRVDSDIVSRFRGSDALRMLILPDHPTPIAVRTHTADPVPFLRWGAGVKANGAKRFTEAEAKKTGFFIENGYNIINILLGRK